MLVRGQAPLPPASHSRPQVEDSHGQEGVEHGCVSFASIAGTTSTGFFRGDYFIEDRGVPWTASPGLEILRYCIISLKKAVFHFKPKNFPLHLGTQLRD